MERKQYGTVYKFCIFLFPFLMCIYLFSILFSKSTIINKKSLPKPGKTSGTSMRYWSIASTHQERLYVGSHDVWASYLVLNVLLVPSDVWIASCDDMALHTLSCAHWRYFLQVTFYEQENIRLQEVDVLTVWCRRIHFWSQFQLHIREFGTSVWIRVVTSSPWQFSEIFPIMHFGAILEAFRRLIQSGYTSVANIK
jgi:hypothetical protein